MRSWLLTLVGIATLGSGPLGAQATDTLRVSHEPLFTHRDAAIAGAFVLGTIALAPVDRYLAHHLQDSTVQANRFFENSSTGFRILGRPGSGIITASLYIVGRMSRQERMAALGLHSTEAIVLADAITRAIKAPAGRARPVVDPENPFHFAFGRGFGDQDYQSFPSGHTTAAFAAAAAITGEIGLWWPQWKPLIGTAMYGGATLVGLSRMYNNKHWASDVMAGAAIGTFSGWKVVSYTHSHPTNRIDHWLLRTSLVPDASGDLLLVWSVGR